MSEIPRATIQRRYPASQILLESAWHAANFQGRAVDFRRSAAGGSQPTITRLAMARIGSTLIEISFTSPAGEFHSHLAVCDDFLRSLLWRNEEESPISAGPQTTALMKE